VFHSIKYEAGIRNGKSKLIEELNMPFVKFDMKRKMTETESGIKICPDLLSPG
jgi:hypothetical protein